MKNYISMLPIFLMTFILTMAYVPSYATFSNAHLFVQSLTNAEEEVEI